MQNNNVISKKIAHSVLAALISPEDKRILQYKQAVVMCGLPGSGKSTIARLLETCYGFERFSSDQIRTEELFKGQAHRQASEHERVMMARYLVYEELTKRIVRALMSGKRVVVDGTNLDAKRYGVIGGIASQIPQDRIALILIKPPEWIIRQRFELEGREAKRQWWGVYKYWKGYLKEGKAAFPTPKLFPQVTHIPVRRYALKTFDWVPDIKAILWELDGTIFRNTLNGKERRLVQMFDRLSHLKHYAITSESEDTSHARLAALGLNKQLFETIDIVENNTIELAYKKMIRHMQLKPEQILKIEGRDGQEARVARELGLKTAFVWGVSRNADVSLKHVFEVAELFGIEV
jgi:adenylate kinase family enzyme